MADKSRTRILFLSANPRNDLKVIKEFNNIRETIQSSRFGDQFEFDQWNEQSIERLQQRLLDYNPHIIHFAGHGTEDGILVFQDQDGRPEGASIEAIARLFKILNERPSTRKEEKIRCVVLNACYTEKQAEPIARYVDCVIGMSDSVADDAALLFAESFYRALASGENVKTAYELGKSQVELKNLPGYEIPKIEVRFGADVSTIVFAAKNLKVYDDPRSKGSSDIGVKVSNSEFDEFVGIEAKEMSEGKASAAMDNVKGKIVKGIKIDKIGHD